MRLKPRTVALSLGATALALSACVLAAAPAQAANEWTPTSVPEVTYTLDQDVQADFRFTYSGSSTTISSIDFTVDAPAGSTFMQQTPNQIRGTGGYARVTEQYTASPRYVPCTLASATKLRCQGGLVDNAGASIASVPLNSGDTILLRTRIVVPTGASGALDAPFIGSGTVTTALGQQTAAAATVGTIDLPQVADTPVIAPAIAGLALLGAAGIGGVAFTRRKAGSAAQQN